MIIPGFPVLTARRPPIQFIAASTSTGATITIPAAAKAGDFCFIVDTALNSPTPSSVVPSGYTQIGSDLLASSNTVKNTLSRKTLSGSDPGGAITGMGGNFVDAKIALVFRPRQGAWGSPTQTGVQAASGTISNQTIGTAVAPYIAIGVWGGNIEPARGFSPAQDGEVQGFAYARWKIFNDGPAAVTLTCDSGTGGWRILRSIRVPLTL